MDQIKEICEQIRLKPRRLVEVGAAHPTTYRLDWFVKNGYPVTLIEANPRLHYCLSAGWNENDFKEVWLPGDTLDKVKLPPAPHQNPGLKDYRNCEIINAAVTDQRGSILLFERNASTFVQGVQSPAKTNDGYQEDEKDAYKVPAITIDQVDDGNIDVLLSDTEGCEWFCIKNLKSRPKLIVLELRGQRYINPYMNEILDWMAMNGYGVAGYDQTDFVFIRRQ